MPRPGLPTRVLPKLAPLPAHKLYPRSKKGPALYNAKRRIKESHGLHRDPDAVRALEALRKDPLSTSWRKYVSPDVTEFIDDMEAQGTKLLPEEQLRLLENPSRYFSRPQNVPTNLRKQVYFPTFSVAMIRSERMGPYYATFDVPRWFNKFDMKDYLKELYDVDVVHVRSSIMAAGIRRESPHNPFTRGEAYRGVGRKRMVVQLVDPFVWPVKVKDINKQELFSTSQYYHQLQMQRAEVDQSVDYYKERLDKKHRKSIAEQAQELLQGKAKWSPTWTSLPDMQKILGEKSDSSTAVSPPPAEGTGADEARI